LGTIHASVRSTAQLGDDATDPCSFGGYPRLTLDDVTTRLELAGLAPADTRPESAARRY
jgi:hypothetical protein